MFFTRKLSSALFMLLMTLTADTFTKDNGFSGWIVMMAQRKLNADGVIGAKKTVSIRCSKLLSGKGSVIAPEVTIVVKKFDFRGTIDCSGTCVITTQEPFDEMMFTKKGDGKFIVNVDPYLRFPENEWTLKSMVKAFAVCAACAGAAAAYDHYYGENHTRNLWKYFSY